MVVSYFMAAYWINECVIDKNGLRSSAIACSCSLKAQEKSIVQQNHKWLASLALDAHNVATYCYYNYYKITIVQIMPKAFAKQYQERENWFGFLFNGTMALEKFNNL